MTVAGDELLDLDYHHTAAHARCRLLSGSIVSQTATAFSHAAPVVDTACRRPRRGVSAMSLSARFRTAWVSVGTTPLP
jgi:hypothetical protein